MLRRQTTVEVTGEVKRTSSITVGKWLAVLVAIVTPLCYLNGRAFHDGYLARLHLEPSMFPSDVQGTFLDAARAWLEGSATVLVAVSTALKAHWFLTVVLPILLLTGLSAAIHYLIYRAEAKRASTLQREERSRRVRVISSVLAPVCTLLVGAYAIYTLFALIGAALLLSIGPFVQVGAHSAANDLEKGFPNAPSVELSAPHGSATSYRIIQCADKFCAVYRDGEVVTVPITAITWATSRVSDAAPKR